MQTVFVIEDDEDTRDMMGTVLSQADVSPMVFSSFEEALGAADNHKPCVIVMDYMVGSAMTAAEFVKEARGKLGCKFLLVSGANNIDKVAIELGVDLTLPKPFDLEDLFNSVNQLKNPVIHGV